MTEKFAEHKIPTFISNFTKINKNYEIEQSERTFGLKHKIPNSNNMPSQAEEGNYIEPNKKVPTKNQQFWLKTMIHLNKSFIEFLKVVFMTKKIWSPN